MNLSLKDRGGMGAAGAAVAVVAVLLTALVLGNALAPFAGKQTISEGDTLVYRHGSGDDSYEMTFTFNSVDDEGAMAELSSEGYSLSLPVSWRYDGDRLGMDWDLAFPFSVFFYMGMFDLDEDESEYSVRSIGLSPVPSMDFHKDVAFLGVQVMISVKAGTEIPVHMEVHSSQGVEEVRLVSTSISWMALL